MADRTTRAEEVRQERRRKPGSTVHLGIKLGLPEEQLDRKAHAHRWVNDTGDRVEAFKRNDWDPVQIDGRTESRVVGTDSGQPVKAVLMRKRKDWYDADYKESQKPLDDIEKDIKRGAYRNEAELSRDITYSPNDGNKLDAETGVSIKE